MRRTTLVLALGFLIPLVWPYSAHADITPPVASNIAPQVASGDFMKAAVVAKTQLPEQPKVTRGGKYKAGSAFGWGWCTYEASRLRGGVPFTGNAREWLANAKRAKVPTGNKPRVGAIMVENISYYGHVSVVQKVNADGSYQVREMNYKGFGVVSYRTLKKSYKPMGFIF
jgi:surface antigen